jgi:flagellar FliL protein
MGKKKVAKAEGEGEAGEKKSSKSKIIIAVVCVALGAGGYMLGGQGAAEQVSTESTTTTTLVQKLGCKDKSVDDSPKTVVDLPAMSINLTDGHYLRIGASLGLCDEIVVSDTEPFKSAPAKDVIVALLSGKTMEELSTEEGRAEAKKKLIEGITKVYPGVVYTVFLAEFVMQ